MSDFVSIDHNERHRKFNENVISANKNAEYKKKDHYVFQVAFHIIICFKIVTYFLLHFQNDI